MSRKAKTANSCPGANSEKSSKPKCKGASVAASESGNAKSIIAELSLQIVDLAPGTIISIDESRAIIPFNVSAEFTGLRINGEEFPERLGCLSGLEIHRR